VARILEGVMESYVLIAELVVGWRWAPEMYRRDGRLIGGDRGLLGWGAVKGVLEDACAKTMRPCSQTESQGVLSSQVTASSEGGVMRSCVDLPFGRFAVGLAGERI
jgi:hypothetical protein